MQNECNSTVQTEEWDKCVRGATWRVALGVVAGTIGTLVLASESPVILGTGLGMGWAVKHCRWLFTEGVRLKQAAALGPGPVKEDEAPCDCGDSDFQALNSTEFDDYSGVCHTEEQLTSQQTNEDTRCSCGPVGTWSAPRSATSEEIPCSCTT